MMTTMTTGTTSTTGTTEAAAAAKKKPKLMNHLVWYEATDKGGWWPALWYPSHMLAGEVAVNQPAVAYQDENAFGLQLAKEITSSTCGDGDKIQRPAVQLLLGSDSSDSTTRNELRTCCGAVHHNFTRGLVLQKTNICQNANLQAAIQQSMRRLQQEVRDEKEAEPTAAIPTPRPSMTAAESSNKNSFPTSITAPSNAPSTTSAPQDTSAVKIVSTPEDDNFVVVNDSNGDDDDMEEDNSKNNTMQADDDAQDNSKTTQVEQPTKAIDILVHDSFDKCVAKLRSANWYTRAEKGNPMIKLYVKPGCRILAENTLNVDYFTQQGLEDYLAKEHGWQGPREPRPRRVTLPNETTSGTTTPAGQRTKPQDPGIPQSASSVESDCSSAASVDTQATEDYYANFTALWRELKKEGWKHKNSRNPLENFVYIRPGKSVTDYGCVEGVDYFKSESAVIEYCKANDERQQQRWPRQQHAASSRKRKQEDLPKRQLLGDERSKKKSAQSAAMSIGKKKKHTPATIEARRSNQPTLETSPPVHWWKKEKVPTNAQVQPILKKLGFTKKMDKFCLPQATQGVGRVAEFSQTGLRKFLCMYGIPGYAQSASSLKDEEKDKFERWIKFANVPISGGDSVKQLGGVPSPSKKGPSNVKKLLHKVGFESLDGKLYVPNYKDIDRANGLPWHRNSEKHGIHYFHDSELNTLVRAHVRGALKFGTILEKKRSAKMQKDILELRLWAAVASADLPQFPEKPDEAPTSAFEAIADEQDEVEETAATCSADFSSSDQADVDILPNPDTKSNEEKDGLSFASPGQSSSVGSPESSIASLVSTSSHWYTCKLVPSFAYEAWPILQRLGFTYSGGNYGHAVLKKPIGNSVDVQHFVIKNGIPGLNMDSISEDEAIVLERWAKFAHVPVKPSNSIAKLSAANLLTSNQVNLLLPKLGFKIYDQKYYPPGADQLANYHSEDKHGLHHFRGIEEIRDYVRANQTLSLVGEEPRRRKQAAVTESEMLELRLWAALSPSPIPTYQSSGVETKLDSSLYDDVGNDPMDVVDEEDMVVAQYEDSFQADDTAKATESTCVEEESSPVEATFGILMETENIEPHTSEDDSTAHGSEQSVLEKLAPPADSPARDHYLSTQCEEEESSGEYPNDPFYFAGEEEPQASKTNSTDKFESDLVRASYVDNGQHLEEGKAIASASRSAVLSVDRSGLARTDASSAPVSSATSDGIEAVTKSPAKLAVAALPGGSRYRYQKTDTLVKTCDQGDDEHCSQNELLTQEFNCDSDDDETSNLKTAVPPFTQLECDDGEEGSF